MDNRFDNFDKFDKFDILSKIIKEDIKTMLEDISKDNYPNDIPLPNGNLPFVSKYLKQNYYALELIKSKNGYDPIRIYNSTIKKL